MNGPLSNGCGEFRRFAYFECSGFVGKRKRRSLPASSEVERELRTHCPAILHQDRQLAANWCPQSLPNRYDPRIRDGFRSRNIRHNQKHANYPQGQAELLVPSVRIVCDCRSNVSRNKDVECVHGSRFCSTVLACPHCDESAVVDG